MLWHTELHARNDRNGTVKKCFCVVHTMPIARQQISKHIPAEAYRGTIRRSFLGNGAVNTPTNCWDTVFSVGSAPGIPSEQSVVERERGWSESSAVEYSAEDLLWAVVNLLRLRMFVKEVLKKSNYPVQSPLVLVTEPRTRDSILIIDYWFLTFTVVQCWYSSLSWIFAPCDCGKWYLCFGSTYCFHYRNRNM
jgi:hypothetical protein